MLAYSRRRTSTLTGVIALLAGLLLPPGAGADEPSPQPESLLSAAPIPPQAGVEIETQVSGMLGDGRCDLALETLQGVPATQRPPHQLLWLCRAYAQCGAAKDAIFACNAVLNVQGVFSAAEHEEAQRSSAQAQQRYLHPPVLGIEPDDLRAMQSRPPVRSAPEVAVAAENTPVWNGMSRFYFRVRPLWSLYSIVGGALLDAGFEHTFTSGLLLGADIAPVTALFPLFGVQGRLRLGYGGRSFAIGVGAGGGVANFDLTRRRESSIYYAQVGGFLRAGRLDRTYVEISLYMALPNPYPFNGLFHLSARTSERWRYKLDLGVDFLLSGPYMIMGGERLLKGSGGRASSAINFGIGLVFPLAAYGIPGPMLSIGYEKRF